MSIIGTLEHILNREPWQERGVCRQVDIGDMFFPDKGGSTKEAKRICAVCPVAAECLQYALDHDERFGIWGGFSERERRRMKRDIPRDEVVLLKACKGCGEAFLPQRNRVVYCSRECWRNNDTTMKRRKCVQCGARFTGSTACCSDECRASIRRPTIRPLQECPNRYLAECRTCGVEFDATHHRARYCSDECRTKAVLAQQRSRHHGEIA